MNLFQWASSVLDAVDQGAAEKVEELKRDGKMNFPFFDANNLNANSQTSPALDDDTRGLNGALTASKHDNDNQWNSTQTRSSSSLSFPPTAPQPLTPKIANGKPITMPPTRAAAIPLSGRSPSPFASPSTVATRSASNRQLTATGKDTLVANALAALIAPPSLTESSSTPANTTSSQASNANSTSNAFPVNGGTSTTPKPLLKQRIPSPRVTDGSSLAPVAHSASSLPTTASSLASASSDPPVQPSNSGNTVRLAASISQPASPPKINATVKPFSSAALTGDAALAPLKDIAASTSTGIAPASNESLALLKSAESVVGSTVPQSNESAQTSIGFSDSATSLQSDSEQLSGKKLDSPIAATFDETVTLPAESLDSHSSPSPLLAVVNSPLGQPSDVSLSIAPSPTPTPSPIPPFTPATFSSSLSASSTGTVTTINLTNASSSAPASASASLAESSLSSVNTSSVLPLARGSSGKTSTSSDPLRAENEKLKSDIEELNNEIGQLRNVWNESRSALAKAKQMLRQKEEAHRARLADYDSKLADKLAEQERAHAESNRFAQTQLTDQMREFESALKMKTEVAHRFDQERKDLQSIIEQRESEIIQLKQLLQDNEKENESALKQQHELIESHSRAVHSLRTDFAAREIEWEREMELLRETSKAFQSQHILDSSHESPQQLEEMTKALASLQQELYERQRTFDRLTTEKRALNSELSSVKEELESWRKRLESSEKEKNAALNSLNDKLTSVLSDSERWRKMYERISEETKKIQEDNFQVELSNSNSKNVASEGTLHQVSKQQLEESQQRVKNLTEHLLAKSSQLERAAAERASLKIQLENENLRVNALDKQVHTLRQRVREAEGEDDNTNANGNGNSDDQLQPIRRRNAADLMPAIARIPQVQRAVTFLDGLGTALGGMLRRYPMMRLLFVLYVLLIHLWVVYVLNHFASHVSQNSSVGPVPTNTFVVNRANLPGPAVGLPTPMPP